MDLPEENKKDFSSSFQNSLDTSLFYEQCSRRTLLNEVKKAVFDSVSHLTIYGEEGSGKTMLCKMVEEELAAHYLVVFYGVAVESFEDVIRHVALKTGIQVESEIKREEVNDLLVEILTQLKDKNKKLLVIFDEAEKVFLATLERIRKMLDVLNESGLYLQVLFSGEESLKTNLQQLSLCTFHGATERSFSLQPLDKQETFNYLNFRLRSSRRKEYPFSREQSERIYEEAGGNFAKINRAASSILQDASPASMSPASERVQRTRKGIRKKIKWKRFSFPPWLQRPQFLSGIGALAVIVVLVVILLNRGEDSESIDQSGKSQPQITKEKVVEPKGRPAASPDRDVSKKGSVNEVEKSKLPSQQQTAGNTEDRKSKTLREGALPSSTGASEKATKGDSKARPKTTSVATGRIETQPFIVISSESSRFISKKTDLARIPSHSSQNDSVDQLFDKRVAAAVKWRKKENWKLYTIQLMLLSADSAEENVKKVLRRQEYQEISDRLYFLRAAGPPPSVYMFYGEFPSLAAAKSARNRLPLFLRKHEPYITSVKYAVEKVEDR